MNIINPTLKIKRYFSVTIFSNFSIIHNYKYQFTTKKIRKKITKKILINFLSIYGYAK